MFCARCGKPVQPGTAFCPYCGQPTQMQEARAMAPAQRGAFPYIAALIATLVLAASGFVMFARASVQKDATAPDNAVGKEGSNIKPTLTKEGSIGAPAVGKEGGAPPPSISKEGDAPPAVVTKTAEVLSMPSDVRAWLEHLRKIEQKKQEITMQQISELKVFQEMLQTLGPGIGMLDPYLTPQGGDEGKGPDSVTKGKFEDLRPQWKKLIEEFQVVPPPTECQPLANTYYEGLNEIPAMAGDLIDVLNKAQSDPSAALAQATSMKTKSYHNVDKQFTLADEQLSEICLKYNVTKWFNLKADVMGGSMLGASDSSKSPFSSP